MQKFIGNKKALGNWGERCVDLWLKGEGWQILKKNMYFKGGEIDRIYIFKHPKTAINIYCVSEIKLLTLQRKNSIDFAFSELHFRKILRFQQMKNLFYCAEKINATTLNNSRIYIRVFIVIIGNLSTKNLSENKIFWEEGKLCTVGRGYCIFSFQPEFTPQTHGQNRNFMTTGI
ncbi:MAG: YraN family protein [Silvanigrellaceae bacterium]|nr:YraN family protein [Silvanigrellaceae bacterium]